MATDFIKVLQEIRGTGRPEDPYTDGIYYELVEQDHNGNPGKYGDILDMYIKSGNVRDSLNEINTAANNISDIVKVSNDLSAKDINGIPYATDQYSRITKIAEDANITNMSTIVSGTVIDDMATIVNADTNLADIQLTADNLDADGTSGKIQTVADNLAQDGVSGKVQIVSDNIGHVITVATDISSVIDVANDLNEAISEIDTVANDLNETTSEINTVADNLAKGATSEILNAEANAISSLSSANSAGISEFEAEASRRTTISYATEAEDTPVNIYTSNGDGTYTVTPQPGVYSTLHHDNKCAASEAATSQDALDTAQDSIDTNADKVQTGLDRVQTGLDRIATGNDLAATTQDAIDTAADRVQTGLDALSSEDSNLEALSRAAEAEDTYTKTYINGVPSDTTEYSAKHYQAKSHADATQTALDRIATGNDVVTTNSNASTASTNSAQTAQDSIDTNDNKLEAQDWASKTTGVVNTYTAGVANADGTEYSAKKYAANSATSASAAHTSETNASSSAVAASTSATESNNWAEESSNWATYTIDSPVPEGDGTEYSARHWANKAALVATGSLKYLGTWDATTAYPANSNLGDYYKVIVAGPEASGPYTYNPGDAIIYNGTDWDLMDGTDKVASVDGQIGNVDLSSVYEPKNGNIQYHISSTGNPHSVTKAQVGLGNVDNTSDIVKNVNSATKLTTSRTISLSGDVSGTTTFDGSSNVGIVATIVDDSHNHSVLTGGLDLRHTNLQLKLTDTTYNNNYWMLDHQNGDLSFSYNGVTRALLLTEEGGIIGTLTGTSTNTTKLNNKTEADFESAYTTARGVI